VSVLIIEFYDYWYYKVVACLARQRLLPEILGCRRHVDYWEMGNKFYWSAVSAFGHGLSHRKLIATKAMDITVISSEASNIWAASWRSLLMLLTFDFGTWRERNRLHLFQLFIDMFKATDEPINANARWKCDWNSTAADYSFRTVLTLSLIHHSVLEWSRILQDNLRNPR